MMDEHSDSLPSGFRPIAFTGFLVGLAAGILYTVHMFWHLPTVPFIQFLDIVPGLSLFVIGWGFIGALSLCAFSVAVRLVREGRRQAKNRY